MEMNHLCAGIRERVSLELRHAAGRGGRAAVLVEALYEVSRTVLPALGSPRKSLEYQKALEAVLDLISCIAIPLVREGDERGVAVLSELAEGSRDPLLKKKLSVYAHELLAKSGARCEVRGVPAKSAAWVLASCTAAALVLYLAWPGGGERKLQGSPAPSLKSAAPAVSTPGPAVSTPGPLVAPAAPARPERVAEGGRPQERCEPPPPKQEKIAAAAVVTPHGEQVTRVRVLNNQVLIPVTLKHGGASVRLELLLDTGATRTALHEVVAGRLPIDLRSARAAMAEVADGRLVHSRIARFDLLSVGPFSHPSMELELIPFQGRERVHDGLLGMDFLGKHRYQIDMEHELIRWF